MSNPIPQLPAHCYIAIPSAAALKASAPVHRRFWRMVLRFFNIVEPGPEVVLSWTKIAMPIVLGLVIFLAVSSPGNLAAVIGALVTAAPFVVNYMHQRQCDAKTGANPNRFQPPAAVVDQAAQVSA